MHMSDLRMRQRELGRQTIVDATADLVTERHHLDFTMREVAERSGVSLRTVYNHFPTREDLLAALGDDFTAKMSERGGLGIGDVDGLDEMLDAVAANQRTFDELGGISEAFAQMPLAHVGVDEQRTSRTAALVSIITDAMPEVPETEADAIARMLRHMFSHRSWFWLTHEYGLSTEATSDVVRWAVRTLVDAANRGDLPDLGGTAGMAHAATTARTTSTERTTSTATPTSSRGER